MADFAQVLSQNTMSICIAIIAIFLLFQFFILPRFFGNKGNLLAKEKKSLEPPQVAVIDSEPDNPGKRISRGFGVMMDKLRGSSYVQAIKEEQERPGKFTDMLPPEIFDNKEDSTKDSNTKEDKQDPFATTPSSLTKVDI